MRPHRDIGIWFTVALPDHTAEALLACLRQRTPSPQALQGMARYGLQVEGRLGWSIPELRALAREAGRDHARALVLWDSGIPDAQILAALTAEPGRFTQAQMDHWVAGVGSWDVCDQACSNAFAFSPRAWAQPQRWAARKPEFVRRAAFSLVAALTVHDKAAGDERFLALLQLIESAADDDRNFVRKAVNWALRQIGKRNPALREAAMLTARRLRERPSRAARWIAADALRELERR